MRQYKVSYLMYIIYFRGNDSLLLFDYLLNDVWQSCSRTLTICHFDLYLFRSKVWSGQLEYRGWYTATIRTCMASSGDNGGVSDKYFGNRLPSIEFHLDCYVVNANWWVRRKYITRDDMLNRNVSLRYFIHKSQWNLFKYLCMRWLRFKCMSLNN